jgi:cytochrome c oxidase subunit 2
MHDTVWILTLILISAAVAAFATVALKSSAPAPTTTATAAYKGRTILFWVLLAAGVAITFGTTRALPYLDARSAGGDRVDVDVEGHQWYWTLSTDRARSGDTVVFNVSAADVNHGLGIYDQRMRLVAQTQAMPGYTNRLRYRFDAPGTYKLLCLEYCGTAHHAMVSDFVIEEAPATRAEHLPARDRGDSE